MTKPVPSIPWVGVNFKWSQVDDVVHYADHIDCLEIKPEHFFSAGKSLDLLHIINERLPLIAHGLQLSIGSAEGLSKRYLNKLDRFFRYAPSMAWIGEHTGFSRAGGIEIPHFCNLPYTTETLKVITRNIATFRNGERPPLLLENIPWEFSFPESTMDEPEFFSRLTDATDCGLLLDVTNLYANSVNFGWDLETYLRDYPLHRVVQVHFNGGRFDSSGKYIDSHSEATPGEVWDIIRELLRRKAPVKAFILERDDETEPGALLSELEKMRNLIEGHTHGT